MIYIYHRGEKRNGRECLASLTGKKEERIHITATKKGTNHILTLMTEDGFSAIFRGGEKKESRQSFTWENMLRKRRSLLAPERGHKVFFLLKGEREGGGGGGLLFLLQVPQKEKRQRETIIFLKSEKRGREGSLSLSAWRSGKGKRRAEIFQSTQKRWGEKRGEKKRNFKYKTASNSGEKGEGDSVFFPERKRGKIRREGGRGS